MALSAYEKYIEEQRKKRERKVTPITFGEKKTTSPLFKGVTSSAKTTKLPTPTRTVRSAPSTLGNVFVEKTTQKPSLPTPKLQYKAPTNVYAQDHKSVSALDEQTEKLRGEELRKSKIMQTAAGAAYGFLPFAPAIDEDRQTAFTKAGSLIGTLASYGLGYGAAKGGIQIGGKTVSTLNAANKLAKTQKATQLATNMSKNKIFQNIAKETLKRTSQPLTKEAIDIIAKESAEKALTSAITAGVEDFTVGGVLDMAQTSKQGYKIGSDEWLKEMGKNALINIGVGGAIEGLPYAVKPLARKITDPKQVAKATEQLKEVKTDFPTISSKKVTNATELRKQKANLVKDIQKSIDNKDFTRARELTSELKSLRNTLEPTPIKEVAEEVVTPMAKEVVEPMAKATETVKPMVKATEEVSPSGVRSVDEVLEQARAELGETRGTLPEVVRPTVEPITSVSRGAKTLDGVNVESVPKSADMGKLEGISYEPKPSGIIKSDLPEAQRLDREFADLVRQDETMSQAAPTVYKGMQEQLGKEVMIEQAELGKFTNQFIPNRVNIQRAVDAINKDGIEKTVNQLKYMADNGEFNSKAISKGIVLLDVLEKRGEKKLLESVAESVVSMASESGRSLQLMKLIPPSYKRNYLRNMLKKVGREHKGDSNFYLNLPEIQDLVKRYDEINARDFSNMPDGALKQKAISIHEDELQKELDKIIETVWDNTPKKLSDIFETYRYTAMLANPKTHMRNIVGNTLFGGMKIAKTDMEAMLQKALIKDPNMRTRSMVHSLTNEADRKLVQLGKQQYQGYKDSVKKTGKFYDMMIRPLISKSDKGETVGLSKKALKAIKSIPEANFKALNLEDSLFMEKAFSRAYAGFIKAKGVGFDEITPQLDEMAKAFAFEDALNSTFRDANEFAEKLTSTIKKWKRSDNLIEKAGGWGLDITIPFVKTPANIAKAGIEYEPIFFFKGAAEMAQAAKSGNVDDMLKAIDDISKGTVGSGMLALGAYLAHTGQLQSSRTGNQSLDNYLDAMGEQPYSFKFNVGGETYTYTLDWAAPTAIPLFMGAEIQQMAEELGEKQGLDAVDILAESTDILLNSIEPLLEMTMIRGISDTLKSDYSDDNPIVQVVRKIEANMFNQFIPTLSGQIANTISPYRRSTVSTMEVDSLRRSEQLLNQLKNKSVIATLLSDEAPPMYDVWGNKINDINESNVFNRAFENMFSLGYLSKIKDSPVDDEIMRVYHASVNDKNNVLPKRYTNYDLSFDFNSDNSVSGDEEFRMTPEEYAEFSRVKGSQSYIRLSNLFNNYEYKNATNEEKKKMIASVYTGATESAKERIYEMRGASPTEIAFDRVSVTNGKKEDYVDSTVGKRYGINLFMDLYNSDVKSANGTYIKDKLYNWLEGTNLTRAEKREMYSIFSRTKTNPYD